MTAEIANLLMINAKRAFSLRDVIANLREGLDHSEVNSALCKLVHKHKVEKGSRHDGRRDVNIYRWLTP